MNELATRFYAARSMTKVLNVEMLVDRCRVEQPVNTIYCLSNISKNITVCQNATNDMESSMKSCLNSAFLSLEQYVTVFGLDVYCYYFL